MLEVDPMSHMGDIGRTSPHRGDPVMSPDLGGGQGPGGAGRGSLTPKSTKPTTPAAKPAVRVEPTLEKPRLVREPTTGKWVPKETPPAKPLAKPTEPAMTATRGKPEALPTDRQGRIEPSMAPMPKMKAGRRAPLPPQQKSLGQSIKDMPHKKKAAAAAAAAGAYWWLNREPEPQGSATQAPTTTTVEPADNWGKAATTPAPQGTQGGSLGGAGAEVSDQPRAGAAAQDQAKTQAGRAGPERDTQTPGTGTADTQGTSTTQGTKPGVELGPDNDSFYWSKRMRNINESSYNMFVTDPVTGQPRRVVQPMKLNAQPIAESWQANFWITTPVSKILKEITNVKSS